MKEQHLAYWVDLQAIAFEESKPNASWLQAFPIGEYKHPMYGKIKMTFDRAKGMAQNVIHKVRGIDIAIDYGHNSGGEAAGWVSSAEARQDGLWLFVEWTEEAANDIRSGKYRYFSPEYVENWEHPQSGKKFKDVLFGGGLTNRPFLKNIMPVNLSEVLDHEDSSQVDQPRGGDMEKLLKALRDQFKLAEDADEDAIIEAFTKSLQAETKEEPVESLSEEEVAKILEEHPAMAGILEQNKALAEQNQTLVGRVVNLELSGRQDRVSAKLSEWHAGGEKGKHGLPTALDEKITSFMLSANEEQVSAFTDIMEEIVKTGMVSIGETSQRKRTESDSSALSEVEAGIKTLMEENEGMSYADASSALFSTNEALFERYLEEMADEEVEA
jgi:phage I-like protein